MSSPKSDTMKDNLGQGELYSPAHAIRVDPHEDKPLIPQVMKNVKHKVLEKLVTTGRRSYGGGPDLKKKASQLLDSVAADAAAALSSSPSPSMEEALSLTKTHLTYHNHVAKIVSGVVQELVTEQQQKQKPKL